MQSSTRAQLTPRRAAQCTTADPHAHASDNGTTAPRTFLGSRKPCISSMPAAPEANVFSVFFLPEDDDFFDRRLGVAPDPAPAPPAPVDDMVHDGSNRRVWEPGVCEVCAAGAVWWGTEK